MTFAELLELVQTGKPAPKVLSDYKMASYLLLRFLRADLHRLQSSLDADEMSRQEYAQFRRRLHEQYRWVQDWFDREERQFAIQQEKAVRLNALGQFYKQAVEEQNTLAIRMCDIWDGLRTEQEGEK